MIPYKSERELFCCCCCTNHSDFLLLLLLLFRSGLTLPACAFCLASSTSALLFMNKSRAQVLLDIIFPSPSFLAQHCCCYNIHYGATQLWRPLPFREFLFFSFSFSFPIPFLLLYKSIFLSALSSTPLGLFFFFFFFSLLLLLFGRDDRLDDSLKRIHSGAVRCCGGNKLNSTTYDLR